MKLATHLGGGEGKKHPNQLSEAKNRIPVSLKGKEKINHREPRWADVVGESSRAKEMSSNKGKGGLEPMRLVIDLMVAPDEEGRIKEWLSKAEVISPIDRSIFADENSSFSVRERLFSPQIDLIGENCFLSTVKMKEEVLRLLKATLDLGNLRILG